MRMSSVIKALIFRQFPSQTWFPMDSASGERVPLLAGSLKRSPSTDVLFFDELFAQG